MKTGLLDACWRGLPGGRTDGDEKLAEITMKAQPPSGGKRHGLQPHERDPPRPILPVGAVRPACIIAYYVSVAGQSSTYVFNCGLSVRMFGSGGKKRANASSNCAAL